MSCSCPKTNDGRGHDVCCELYQTDKYRLKAQQLVLDWGQHHDGVFSNITGDDLIKRVSNALTEAAREAMERAIVISIREAEAWSADRVGHSIAEAIRKEMP